jgi:hypothetical protein
MCGIFVAYHNTREFFGFQFIPREEMDSRLYGNSRTGDAAFNLLLQIYNRILRVILPLHRSDATLRLTFGLKNGPDWQVTIFSEEITPSPALQNGVNQKGNPDFEPYDASKPGVNQHQHELSLVSFLDKKWAKHVLLNNVKEEWDVDVKIRPVPRVAKAEYDAARAKILLMARPLDGQPGISNGSKFAQMAHRWGNWSSEGGHVGRNSNTTR